MGDRLAAFLLGMAVCGGALAVLLLVVTPAGPIGPRTPHGQIGHMVTMVFLATAMAGGGFLTLSWHRCGRLSSAAVLGGGAGVLVGLMIGLVDLDTHGTARHDYLEAMIILRWSLIGALAGTGSVAGLSYWLERRRQRRPASPSSSGDSIRRAGHRTLGFAVLSWLAAPVLGVLAVSSGPVGLPLLGLSMLLPLLCILFGAYTVVAAAPAHRAFPVVEGILTVLSGIALGFFVRSFVGSLAAMSLGC